MNLRLVCFAALVYFLFFFIIGALNAQVIYHTGNDQPVATNHLPGLVLAGGATDNNDAMKWMLERADGGDVVVLRASGSDGYNNYFYSGLGVSVNSVTSIVIQSTAHANSEEVVEILNNAEVVFIAGGNQWNYVNHWRDSALLEALQQLIAEKQITIGGTSAGMAVLGEVIFTAENQTVWSSEALGDPYHWRVKLEKDFLNVPFMQYTVTDSHYNREESDGNDRKGRHVAFMARMITDWGMPAKGIAANEYTAIAIDETGRARVFGHPSYPDYGYFLQVFGGVPEVCEEGKTLDWNREEQALKVYKVKGDFDGSGWFDLSSWVNGAGGEWQHWHIDEGVLHESESFDPEGLWLQVLVYAPDRVTFVEGAEVFVEGQLVKTTPIYGSVNFLKLDTNVSLEYQVVADGYATASGVVDLGMDNKLLEVVLSDVDTSVPGKPLGEKPIRLYPNPAGPVLNIDICPSLLTDAERPAIIRIFRNDGRLIFSGKVDELMLIDAGGASQGLTVEHLPAGFYILEYSDKRQVIAVPWIKR